MSDFLTSLVAVVAVLGFMILIHEFGHYAVAKWLGVRVEQFAIGFGKRLVGFRKGDTDYRINAIPLGGYVKMSGENPMDERSEDPREFMNHPRWHRFLIAIAGPTMNILLAITLLTTVYMVHYEYPAVYDEPPVIGWVLKDTAAAKAGFQIGDRITRIDDVQNPTWEQVELKEALSPGQPLDVTVDRNGRTLEKTVTPEAMGVDQIGYAGWAPKEGIVRSEGSAEPGTTSRCHRGPQRADARKNCNARGHGCRSNRICGLGSERGHRHHRRPGGRNASGKGGIEGRRPDPDAGWQEGAGAGRHDRKPENHQR